MVGIVALKVASSLQVCVPQSPNHVVVLLVPVVRTPKEARFNVALFRATGFVAGNAKHASSSASQACPAAHSAEPHRHGAFLTTSYLLSGLHRS